MVTSWPTTDDHDFNIFVIETLRNFKKEQKMHLYLIAVNFIKFGVGLKRAIGKHLIIIKK